MRARSDTQKNFEWELRGSNDGGMGSIIYNPENTAIGGTARCLDVPLNQPKFAHYRSMIEKVDSINTYIVYFQLYSSDEIIERSISDFSESYLDVLYLKQSYKFIFRYIIDSKPARVTPSEKTKLYLTKKLNEIEQKIKKIRRRKNYYK